MENNDCYYQPIFQNLSFHGNVNLIAFLTQITYSDHQAPMGAYQSASSVRNGKLAADLMSSPRQTSVA